MKTNEFVPQTDVIGYTADGRAYLVHAAGVPMTIDRAISLGLVSIEKPAVSKPGKPYLPVKIEHKSPVVNATSAAIKLADEQGIDLANPGTRISRSGKDGTILKSDVEDLLPI
jgi:pyruvate/2-oxoglutarate dehydrogenase complex dihydrolipoamide acyltransferase (E2) component